MTQQSSEAKRPIKFRAWHDGRYYYSDNITEFPELWMFWRFVCRHLIINVEQFTGLTDCKDKGKEAYFGDIAKDEHGQVFVIEWDYPLLARLAEIWFEVVGNVHTDSHLLEGADEQTDSTG